MSLLGDLRALIDILEEFEGRLSALEANQPEGTVAASGSVQARLEALENDVSPIVQAYRQAHAVAAGREAAVIAADVAKKTPGSTSG